MTISIRNSRFTTWTQISAPTPERPFWHEIDDGARHHLIEILDGLDASQAAEIARHHGEAIGAIASAAMNARTRGDLIDARRLAKAAARLSEEIVGLWPVALAAARSAA